MTAADQSTTTDQAAGDQVVPMTDVNGTVVDAYGNPTANAAVRIGMLTANTDMMGKFTLKADATYRIEVVHASGTTTTNKRVLVIDGLTSRTPTIQTESAISRTAQNLNLTLTGIGNTVPAGQKVYVWTTPTSKTSDAPGRIFINNNSTTAMYPASWLGASPATGTMTGLYLTMSSNGSATFPTGFTSFGTTPITLAANGSASVSVNVTSTNISNSPISGSITLGGNTSTAISLTYRSGGLAGPTFYDGNFALNTFNLPMPSVFNWRAVVRSVASTPSGGTSYAWKVGIPAGTSGIMLTHGSDLVPTAPSDAAMMVDANTMFTWPQRNGAAYLLSAVCGTGFAPDVWVDVLTTSTSTNIPDTSTLGSGLVSMGKCNWYVSTFATAKTDDLVGPAGWQKFAFTYLADADGALVSSKLRAFTPK